jgi:hypothetical protein
VDGSKDGLITIDVDYYSVENVQYFIYDPDREVLNIKGYDFYRYSEDIAYDFFSENSYEATADMVVGTWINMGDYTEYTFNADGTGVVTPSVGSSTEFTWEIDNGHFICSESGLRVFNGKVQGIYYDWLDLKKR